LVLSIIWTLVCYGPINRVSKVNLTLNGSHPRWRVGVFEIGHVNVRARVERVYYHFPINRTRDLNPSLSKISRDRPDLPLGHPSITGLVQKIGKCSVSQALMNHRSLLQ